MVRRMERDGELSLREEMGISDQEIAQRKEFLEFSGEDIRRVTDINALAREHAVDIIEGFYRHLLSFEEARSFFRDDPRLVEYVKERQKEYFVQLTEGDYGPEYVESRIKIGTIHEEINLPTKFYLGMYNWYLRTIASRLLSGLKGQPEQAFAVFLSLSKLVFLDIGLAIDTYIQRRERTIKQQQEAQAYLAALVESSEDAIVGGTLDGMVVSWNPAAERTYGYSSGEMKGKPLGTIFPLDRPRELPTILERVRRGERIEQYESEHVRKDGERINVSLTVSPVRDNGGTIIGASAIVRDITRQKQAIEAAFRELSTPVLSVRPDLLTLPVIGPLDSARALQLTEQLLRKVRDLRARVAILDITGVPVVDSRVASHLIQTVEAARLMGCTVILTGISPEIARSLVAIGVDLSRVMTRSDLQSGIEEGERMLGYKVTRTEEMPPPLA